MAKQRKKACEWKGRARRPRAFHVCRSACLSTPPSANVFVAAQQQRNMLPEFKKKLQQADWVKNGDMKLAPSHPAEAHVNRGLVKEASLCVVGAKWWLSRAAVFRDTLGQD